MKDLDELIEAINNCALRIRRQLPQGYLEAVYKNAMVIELRKLGLSFETEKPIKVFYDGLPVGEYKAVQIPPHVLMSKIKLLSSCTPV
jgi:GxxExxY protein